MYLWIDDVRLPPDEHWVWVRTTESAKHTIEQYAKRHNFNDFIVISLDHDAGDFVSDGGDFIRILDWIEEYVMVDETYYFHIHSMNPVGVENMKRIIKKNKWNYIDVIRN